jgi:hypothetical protein
MKKPKIIKIEVSIPKSKITHVTAQSHPEVWNLLLAPEDREAKK